MSDTRPDTSPSNIDNWQPISAAVKRVIAQARAKMPAGVRQ